MSGEGDERTRIVFVDDEQNVLNGLRRSLSRFRKVWDTSFYLSSQEALDAIADDPVDIVVADLRMPGLDGLELLAEVRKRHPETVRIILSGHAERELLLKSTCEAHQFLAKPCEADELKEVLEHTIRMRGMLYSERLMRLASRIESLPSIPSLYTQMIEEIQKPGGSLTSVGRIVSQDIAMSAKMLQLVNSAFFGLRRRINDPVEAAEYLGLDTIKALLLQTQLFSHFEDKSHDAELRRIWEHSTATGSIAKSIVRFEGGDKKAEDQAYLSAMLHDAGKVLMLANVPDDYEKALHLAKTLNVPSLEAERRVVGANHAVLGAYLLGIWGLPIPIVETVAYHAAPSEAETEPTLLLTAVHVADILEYAEREGDEALTGLDLAYLDRAGVTTKVLGWRARIAEQIKSKEEEAA